MEATFVRRPAGDQRPAVAEGDDARYPGERGWAQLHLSGLPETRVAHPIRKPAFDDGRLGRLFAEFAMPGGQQLSAWQQCEGTRFDAQARVIEAVVDLAARGQVSGGAVAGHDDAVVAEHYAGVHPQDIQFRGVSF